MTEIEDHLAREEVFMNLIKSLETILKLRDEEITRLQAEITRLQAAIEQARHSDVHATTDSLVAQIRNLKHKLTHAGTMINCLTKDLEQERSEKERWRSYYYKIAPKERPA